MAVIGCRFLGILHSNLAAIAAIFCQNNSAALALKGLVRGVDFDVVHAALRSVDGADEPGGPGPPGGG